MSDRWDASLTPTPVPGSWSGEPILPAPSMTGGSAATDGTLVYGLVARVSLNRPGYGFRVEHDLPAGVDLVDARPRATVVGDHLIWQLGRVDPGQVIRLEVTVRPHPGVAVDMDELVCFEATYSQNLYFQAPIGRRRLAARVSGPARVVVGEAAEFLLDVANTGNAPVADGRATVTLPPAFQHPDGPTFEFALGELAPGEFRRVTIPARAALPGATVVRAEVTGPADRQAVVEFPSEVAESAEAP